MMNRLATFILFFGALLPALGQGTILMTNIHHRGQIFMNGVPVKAGEASVQLVTMEGERVGNSVEILGAGKFSVGMMTLRGVTGTVSLRIAVTYNLPDTPVVYSDPFQVTLGGSGVPPRPAALLPAINDINYDSNLSSAKQERMIQVDRNTASKFYRASEMSIMELTEDSIAFSFVGTLEVAESMDGPWESVE